MADQEDEGLVIKIPASLFQKQDQPDKQAPRVAGDYHSFARTGIVKIQVERISEHGATQVHSLGFADHEQRLRVFELFDAPALYSKLPKLLEYVHELGCEADGEKRYYAAAAVAELAARQPFLDLKQAIILPWANSDNPWIRSSASFALSLLLDQECHRNEVLMLLNHWVSSGNPLLADAGVAAFYWATESHCHEGLAVVRKIAADGMSVHYQSAFHLFGRIYAVDPDSAITALHGWLLPVAASELCWMAGQLSLRYLRLGDVARSDDGPRQVAEMIAEIWDNPRMPWHGEVQKETTEKMEEWARQVLAPGDTVTPATVARYLAFFHELYEKCGGQKRNRLEYHVQRWEQKMERERARVNRAKGAAPAEAEWHLSYRDLVPH